jgi:hypothetical protein
MSFERDLYENYYCGYSDDDYNLDIKQGGNEASLFQDGFNQCFTKYNPGNHNEFLENFMKIDYKSALPVVQKGNINLNNNINLNLDSISTHSSSNQNNISSDVNMCEGFSHNKEDEEIVLSGGSNTFIRQKKGRPMMDTNVIVDEKTGRVYDPNIDPIGYRKIKK